MPFETTAARQSVETEVEENNALRLSAYPNPFSTQLTVEFSLTETGDATLNLYDMQGALIQELYTGVIEANQPKQVKVDRKSMKEGIYIVRLATQEPSGT